MPLLWSTSMELYIRTGDCWGKKNRNEILQPLEVAIIHVVDTKKEKTITQGNKLEDRLA